MENNHPLLGLGEQFGRQNKATPHLKRIMSPLVSVHLQLFLVLATTTTIPLYIILYHDLTKNGGIVYLYLNHSTQNCHNQNYCCFSFLCCYFSFPLEITTLGYSLDTQDTPRTLLVLGKGVVQLGRYSYLYLLGK